MTTLHVTDYGAGPDALPATNRAAIQAAIDEGLGKGATVQFPPCLLDIDAPIVINPGRDLDARLHIRGTGRRISGVKQKAPTADAFQFRNTTQNLRGIVMDDMWIVGGRRGIWMERCSYMLFRNVAFFQTNEYGVYADNGSWGHEFQSCWWVHLNGDAIRVNGSGDIHVIGGVIGEDAGGIWTTDRLRLTAVRVYQAEDNLHPDGLSDMGQATFTVAAGGVLALTGCDLASRGHLVNVDNARRVVISGGTIAMTDGAVFNVRRDDRAAPLLMTGTAVTATSEAARIHRSAIRRNARNLQAIGNSFEVPGIEPWEGLLVPDGCLAMPNVVSRTR